MRSAVTAPELDNKVLYDNGTATAPAASRKQRKNWRAVTREVPPVLRPKK